MTSIKTKLESKNLSSPDKVLTAPNAKVEVYKVGELTLLRVNLEPGWKWMESVKPTAGTDQCELHHAGFMQQGQMHVVDKSGAEKTFKAGDVFDITPGHEAWVEGDETVVFFDFTAGDELIKNIGEKEG